MTARPPLTVAVLASGQGSNLRALADAIDRGHCHARLVRVITDRPKAAALAWAVARELDAAVVAPKAYPDRAAWDRALADAVGGDERGPELVVLAGFMRLVGPAFLERFGGRTINVHPSLLPAYPGLDAPGQAIAGGARWSGCTVHLVDGGVDTGSILAQAAVPVRPEDDAARLHARIQHAEHRLLPVVVDALARGDRRLEPRARLDAIAGRPRTADDRGPWLPAPVLDVDVDGRPR